MQDYQQRVIDEKKDLDAKIERLETFIDGSAMFAELPSDEIIRLRRQVYTMRLYSEILRDRIAAFKSADQQG